ncbi:4'-phosphopantetheinyl transferase family protein [Flavobacterium sedimenticola]|uniref:4-phosphopantetheinyl transferase n=1 Tax=Flavobacterium sedimenticola TaxID=3043286 RepID=A0ABT6XL98_9FLAO|nr:4-phosphopantetheinyl transferase [Flavobacterium sedimenticola]MDI9255865.1 4-phosphopantetheinyl transferase [Flavobacterium sedimenticola]
MPLLGIKALNQNTSLYVWKITETFDELFRSVALKDVSLARLEGMKSEAHQKGFLSVRRLLMEAGYTDFDLYYDAYGKPHLNDGTHISVSHSHECSVIVLSNQIVGADLELLKEKTLHIAPRFMETFHLDQLSHENQIKKATVIWGIKESVFKIKNEKGISFPEHIFEKPFRLEDKKAIAELQFNDHVEYFDIQFDFIDNYVFVCAFNSGEKK